MNEENTVWNLENAQKSAKDIQFWKAEYIKRNAMRSQCYKELQEYMNYTSREWSIYIQKNYNDDSEIFTKYHARPFKHLQRHLIYAAQRCDYVDNGFNFSENFKDFLSREDIILNLSVFFRFSTEYGYMVDDLTTLSDMNYILKNINSIELNPPVFHINKYYYNRFREDTLSLFNIEPRKVSISSLKFDAEIRTIGKLVYKNEDGSSGKVYSKISLNDKFYRRADFIITGQTLHEEFDLEGVHEEVCDHITWCLYENKRKRNIALTSYEEKAITELYKKMAQGEYYASHRAARAIGLWLWDARHRFEHSQSDIEAVRALREAKVDVGYTESDDRTLLRLLEKTRKGVELGQVVAINKQSGKRSPSDKR